MSTRPRREQLVAAGDVVETHHRRQGLRGNAKKKGVGPDQATAGVVCPRN